VRTALAALFVLAAAPAALAETLVVGEQYVTLQAAVDDANDGDTILVEAGDYGSGATITGFSNLTIRNKGRVIYSAGSITINGGSTGILLRGLEFQNVGVNVFGGGDIVLENLKFSGGGADIASSNVTGLVISRCSFSGTGAEAIFNIDTSGLVVEKCSFEDVEGVAILIVGDSGPGTPAAVVEKNRIRNCAGGVTLNGQNSRVEKNRMEGLSGIGVDTSGFNSTDGATISKNRIRTSGTVAIGGFGDDHFVEKNVLDGGGIDLTGSNQIVEKNRISDAGATAIHLSQVGTVSKNTVSRSAGAGIYVEGSGSVVAGNKVTDADTAGVFVLADGCTIEKNSVTRADQFAFYVDGTGNTFTGNRASGSGGLDLADTGPMGANTYSGNKLPNAVFNFD
jgi:parallel beta-helix repeat protein